MKQTQEQGLPNVRTLEKDPQYFGAFLNMARYNIFTISNHLSEKMLRDNKLTSEEAIADSFLAKDNGRNFNWRLLFAMAQRYMPIAKVFDDETPINDFSTDAQGVDFDKMREDLKEVFKAINEFRNDYSHYYHVSRATERKIKVSDKLKEFINNTYQKALDLTKLRFKANNINQNDILEEKDFKLCEKFTLVKADNTITNKGLVFLINLFLEREYATLFMGKVTGLKGTQFRSFIAAHEVLMAYCIKLPSNKFVSQDKAQALSLDMINEINKCPKTLYQHMTKEGQERFLAKLSLEKQQNVIDNSINTEKALSEEDVESLIQNLSRQTRNSNRFYYYALRFMDNQETFKKWFFHIELGKILSKTYQKPIGNTLWDRNIENNIRAFGRLDNFLPSEKEDIEAVAERYLKAIKADDLNFTQYAPHYHIKNNKIGLAKHTGKITRYKNGKVKQALPDAFLSIHELPKLILLQYLEKGKVENIIDTYVEDNNARFRDREFIDKIKSQLPTDWKKFKKRTDSKNQNAYNQENLNTLHSRKQTINRILANYNTNIKQIPERVLDYWLNIKDIDTDRQVSDYIKKEREVCKQRIKALEKGKAPKIGEMATAMAKDIVNMVVDKAKKQKISSFYYDKIQECLALYADPEKRQLLSTILFRDLKLKETGGHPFIGKMYFNHNKSTYDLYKEYFTSKKTWIDETFYSKKGNHTEIKITNNNSTPYTYRKLQNNKSSLDTWIRNNANGHTATDKKKPIDLPTNLFDNAIIELLQQQLQQHHIAYDTDAKLNQLMKIWWENVRQDKVQGYYNWDREYTIYDTKLQFKPNSKEKFADYYSDKIIDQAKANAKKQGKELQKQQVEKKFKHTLAETEKEIRLLQEQDRMTLLMIEQLLEDEAKNNIKLSQYNSLLNEQITVHHRSSFDQLDDQGNIIPHQTISRTITVTRKRKDISVLKKIEYDTRRLPGLFEYFPEDTSIDMDETLKKELDAYNKAKDIVFDKAFALEKAIVDTLGNPKEAFHLTKDENIPHQPYLKWLQNNNHISEQEYAFLNTIRNSFAHNQFPSKQNMERFILHWGNNTNFAATIANVYEQKIDTILEALS